jgi:YHS domain-containing protein
MCGKPVIEEDAERYEFKKRTYYFCSEGCKGRFERQAERIHVRELARVGNLFGSRKVRWGVA